MSPQQTAPRRNRRLWLVVATAGVLTLWAGSFLWRSADSRVKELAGLLPIGSEQPAPALEPDAPPPRTQKSADRYKQALYLRGERGIRLMEEQVKGMKEDKAVPNSTLKALQEIVNVAGNCGDDVWFDLHKKNFGVNEYGTLIFRDPIYVRN